MALELGIAAAQCRFRVDAEFAGQIDAAKQQIAQFVLNAVFPLICFPPSFKKLVIADLAAGGSWSLNES